MSTLSSEHRRAQHKKSASGAQGRSNMWMWCRARRKWELAAGREGRGTVQVRGESIRLLLSLPVQPSPEPHLAIKCEERIGCTSQRTRCSCGFTSYYLPIKNLEVLFRPLCPVLYIHWSKVIKWGEITTWAKFKRYWCLFQSTRSDLIPFVWRLRLPIRLWNGGAARGGG